MHYKNLKRISPEEHGCQSNYSPPYGWAILGIEQIRQWHHEQAFQDETTYIIAEKDNEE